MISLNSPGWRVFNVNVLFANLSTYEKAAFLLRQPVWHARSRSIIDASVVRSANYDAGVAARQYADVR